MQRKRSSTIRKSPIQVKRTNLEGQAVKILQSEPCKLSDKFSDLEKTMQPLLEKGQTVQSLVDENETLRDMIQHVSNKQKEQNYIRENKLEEIDTAFHVINTNVANLDSKVQMCERSFKINLHNHVPANRNV